MLSLDAVMQQYTPSSELYVDSLRNAVAAHLAERHSVRAQRSAERPRASGLGDRELARVTDLMQERLGAGLSLAELAGLVGLSESQFARAFKARTGVPPHRYLIGLRLDQAQRLLRTSDRVIAEIATACGFANQEHLTRVMRAHRNVTPGRLRSALV
jgi:AraC family transcriptional regulator